MGKGPDKPEVSRSTIEGQKIAVEQWADVKRRFLPLEGKVARITQDKGLRKENELSQVISAGSQAFGGARKDLPRQAVGRGINPNSGAVSETLSDIEAGQGQSVGTSAVGVLQDRENRRRAAGMNTAATGREIEGQTVASYDSVGRIQSARERMIGEARDYEREAYGRAAGQAIGLGVGMNMGGGGVSDDQLVASGGSVGARNASQHLGGSRGLMI